MACAENDGVAVSVPLKNVAVLVTLDKAQGAYVRLLLGDRPAELIPNVQHTSLALLDPVGVS